MKEIKVQLSDLPCLMRVIGKNGISKLYQLVPSRKKLGIALNVIVPEIAKRLEDNNK